MRGLRRYRAPHRPVHVSFDFAVARAVLVDEPVAPLPDPVVLRGHTRWCEREGLATSDGLTAKGRLHAKLVKDEHVFKLAIQHSFKHHGSHKSWPLLIDTLQRMQGRGKPS